MFKALLATHLVLVVFAIGPLVHAATTAARGVRRGDGTATTAAARTLRIYSYASVLVVIIGFALMSTKAPWNPKQHVAEFKDTWIWVSLLLWVVAIAIVLAVIVPSLERATKLIAEQESVAALTGRVAAAGGVVALLFLAVVVLMTYQPGG